MSKDFLSSYLNFKKTFEALIDDDGARSTFSREETFALMFAYFQGQIGGFPFQVNQISATNLRMEGNLIQEDRSVSAGRDITNSIIQTDSHNQATLHAVQLPPSGSVDIYAVVEALRAELLALDVPERGKLERALADAQEEAEKPTPDKEELAGGLGRALGCAKKAGDFSEHAGKIADLVTRIGGWIGAASPYAAPLLAAVGLSAA